MSAQRNVAHANKNFGDEWNSKRKEYLHLYYAHACD